VEIEVLNTSLKGVVVAVEATIALVPEFRGVLRGRFLLVSDILIGSVDSQLQNCN